MQNIHPQIHKHLHFFTIDHRSEWPKFSGSLNFWATAINFCATATVMGSFDSPWQAKWAICTVKTLNGGDFSVNVLNPCYTGYIALTFSRMMGIGKVLQIRICRKIAHLLYVDHFYKNTCMSSVRKIVMSKYTNTYICSRLITDRSGLNFQYPWILELQP